MYRWLLIIGTLLLFSFVNADAQNVSNEGTDFWAVFPTHDPSTNANRTVINYANVRIYITTKTSSQVTVTCGNFNSGPIDIPGNTAVGVDVPRADAYIEEVAANSIIPNKGIHIKVTAGRDKVAVFEHIYAGARSAASLILPREALGRTYYSMNFTQDANGNEVSKNFLTLVAVDPNTRLIIHRKNAPALNVNFTNPGEVYEYIPADREDLTGLFVEVDKTSPDNCDKRFAAYSGSTSLRISCNGSRDPLFQQLYPTGSWGKKYGIVPFIDRRYLFRVLAQEDNTIVQYDGVTVNLDKGAYHTSPELISATMVTANKPISVAQYSLTQACSSIQGTEIDGDPEMVLLNPMEFNVKSTTLFSSTKERILERYINVFIKTSAASSFKINGAAINAVWTPVPANPDYSYTQIPISVESSYLTANEGFNAIAYGFGDHESYAYSAGTNLAASTYFLVSNKLTHRDAQNACVGQESDFKVVLPYEVAKITWKLDDGPEETGPLNPVKIPLTDETFAYEYKYGKDLVFTELRSHTVTVKVELPDDGSGCLTGGAEFVYTFDVFPLPTADFQLPDINCADTELQFLDRSVSNIPNRPLNKWLWDFGDNTTSTDENPKHIFSSSGTFDVKLSVGLDEGCMTDVFVKQITIAPKITAGFDVVAIGCIGKEIAFTDRSVVEPGATIVKWHWDFGDQTAPPADPSASSIVSHTYQSPGTYKITLVTETANGCRSLPHPQFITITTLPEAKFTLPKICSLDQLAEFQNLSVNVNGTAANLSSHWDFGEPASALNTSSDPIGRHKYNQPGVYTVKLTVTNENGCSNSATQLFTVNSPDVFAGFDVLEKDNLCSKNKVKIVNTSSVQSVGKVIKLRIYPDDVNKPGFYLEYNDPEPNQEYELSYPALTTAGPQQFTIRMEAFSGESCFNSIKHDIVLNPSPVLSFDHIPAVCVNGGKIQLTQARETIGIQGEFSYSGIGVTPEGIFDPMVAGVGSHVMTYSFAAHNGGCRESITQTIVVNPIPVLNMPLDLYILEGGEKQIDASVNMSGNTYQWTPSAGLSADNVLSPTFMATSDRVYTLKVTTRSGCYITERVAVHVIKRIETTNAFSPNGDGINDVWTIKYIETYPNVTVDIFNRYGEKVFFSQGYSIPFDGNYKGNPLPVGTYYYMINPKNGKKTITGSLTLIR